ncbi:MAG: DUF2341 domain-containing protein [Crocinitomix sp.]|nr:DUF2341 domain-containing protein [Crocinitomix sp.]
MKTTLLSTKLMLALLSIVFMNFAGQSQTCLTDWTNKVPITIDNTAGSELTDYQIQLIFDTATPIALGEMESDGSDIRFTADGCCDQLCYFIESGINTASTVIWVNIPLIDAAATETIYAFFGNSGAEAVSDAACTFTFWAGFDDEYTGFEYMCGSISDSTVSGGNLNLSWGSSGMIGTAMTFPMEEIYTAEMMSNGVSGTWPAIYWARETTKKNYGLMTNGSQARISLTGGGTDWCSGHNWASILETYTSSEGLWSFTWRATGDLIADFPTVGEITTDNSLYAKDEDLRLLLGGISSGSGSMNLDWVRVRKYAEFPPTIGVELPVVFEPGPLLDLDEEVIGCVEAILDAGEGYAIYDWSSGGEDQLETVDASGTYSITVTDDEGCFQEGSIEVIVAPIYAIELAEVVCSGTSYTFPDGSVEVITETIINTSIFETVTYGCDSLITSTVDVYDFSPELYLGDDITSCDDTVLIDAGDDFASYSWEDGPATQINPVVVSDEYTVTVIDDNGCEQTESINVSFIVIDNGTTLDGFTITADDADAAAYQWLDCDADYAVIDGETGISFEALMDGNYAVELTKGECVDTSACVNISGVSIFENTANLFTVYPNPTQGEINLIFTENTGTVLIRITNVEGKMLQEFENDSNTLQLNIKGEKGIYFLEVITSEGNQVIKIIKD